MVQITFVGFIKDIFDYYQRQRPNDNAMDLWFNEVQRIPDEALPWIKTKIFKENDNKPSNLPATMWALYNVWLIANPSKRAMQTERNCPDCEGGWLVLRKKHEDGKYRTYSAACDSCQQIAMAFRKRLNTAIEQGFERVDLIHYHPHSPKTRNLRVIAGQIGQAVPPQEGGK